MGISVAAKGENPFLPAVQRYERVSTQTGERLHLAFLDGLRGLSALYVVLFHVIADGKEALSTETWFLNFLRFGHEAVVVFIVLSGFVLALPIIRSPQLQLAGGFSGFFKRRARRILPAYYAALLMLPLYITFVEVLKQFGGEEANWRRIRDLFISADMLAHLFLVHNLSEAWSSSINPVLWSLSTEWWIYFVFALILLPIWRRFGIFSALGVSIILGLLPTTLLLFGWPMLAGSPHLLGAFGVGMASAALLTTYGAAIQQPGWRRTLNLTALLSLVAVSIIAIAAPSIRLQSETRWTTDLLIAIACAAFISHTASASFVKGQTLSLGAMASHILALRCFIFLGQFSYSLYLTHLIVWNIAGTTLGLAPVWELFAFSIDPLPIRILVLIPLQLGIAYGFYLFFEKPFLRTRN